MSRVPFKRVTNQEETGEVTGVCNSLGVKAVSMKLAMLMAGVIIVSFFGGFAHFLLSAILQPAAAEATCCGHLRGCI